MECVEELIETIWRAAAYVENTSEILVLTWSGLSDVSWQERMSQASAVAIVEAIVAIAECSSHNSCRNEKESHRPDDKILLHSERYMRYNCVSPAWSIRS